MLPLSNYISDLLFLHNCVVIPELGGFISNIQSAEIDLSREVIYPPSKTIAFNTALTADDGLLINYISHKQQISYNAAKAWLNEQAKDIKHTLLTDGLFILDGLGAFYLDQNRKFRFKTDLEKNILGDSYGLSTLKMPIQFRINSLQRLKTVPINKKEGIMISKKSLMRVAAVLGPILVIAAILPFANKIFSDKQPAQSASIVTVESSKIIIPRDSGQMHQEVAKTFKNDIKEVATQNHQALYYGESDNLYEYHIIAGSYNDRKNAQLLADKLNKEVESAIVLQEGSKYRVSYKQFNDRYEAIKQLDFLRLTTEKEYWVHKVKK